MRIAIFLLLPAFVAAALTGCGGASDTAPAAGPPPGSPATSTTVDSNAISRTAPPASGAPGVATTSPVVILPVVATTSTSFVDDMDSLDSARWMGANWSNGGYFVNGWHPDQLKFQGGELTITLEADARQRTDKRPAVSGEYRTTGAYGWGTYGARLRASNSPGTITAFFLYTGPAEGTRHHEIDIEIKGDDPTRLSVNYWTDGVEHPAVIDLGFDASAGHHDYAFEWLPGSVRWFVDGKLVHEEVGSRGPLPSVPGRLILSLWGATGAEPWSSTYPVTSIPSRMVVDRVSFVAAPGL